MVKKLDFVRDKEGYDWIARTSLDCGLEIKVLIEGDLRSPRSVEIHVKEGQLTQIQKYRDGVADYGYKNRDFYCEPYYFVLTPKGYPNLIKKAQQEEQIIDDFEIVKKYFKTKSDWN